MRSGNTPKSFWQDITDQPRNVWRRAEATRLRFLVDAQNYFAFLYYALLRAQKSVALVGWDMHSDLQLIKSTSNPSYPGQLVPLLESLVKERKGMEVYALNWDFAMIFLFERQIFPIYHFEWSTSRNIHFKMDSAHPVGGSQHQKIVVIDRQLAFVGGIDLGMDRWDTRRHWAKDQRRTIPNHRTYPPFHDMQLAVEGDAAAAIAELVEERWYNATNKKIYLQKGEFSPWPQQQEIAVENLDQEEYDPPQIRSLAQPHLERVPVSLARTIPEYKNIHERREIESLTLAAINNAKKFIYIENQYLTSHSVGRALVQKLKEDPQIEIVIVTPLELAGWLEESSMGVLRSRIIKDMEATGATDRFRLLYPVSRDAANPEQEALVNVHAKIMVCDDNFLHIGSANLSNRSMGLDTELGATIIADFKEGFVQEVHDAIGDLRRSLLAEHFDLSYSGVVQEEQKAQQERERFSLIALIDALREKPEQQANNGVNPRRRTLLSLNVTFTQVKEFVEPMASLADPEKSIQADLLAQRIFQNHGLGQARFWQPARPKSKKQRKPWIKILITAAFFFALAALWHWGPMAEKLRPEVLLQVLQPVQDHPYAPFIAVGGFVLAGTSMVPVTMLVVTMTLLFGPVWGFVYSMLGSLLSSASSFYLGKALWQDALRKLAGSKINSISSRLDRHSLWLIATMRVLPVAPFAVINMVAGSVGIRPHIFLLGTLIGMIPGTFALSLLSGHVLKILKKPDWSSVGLAVVVLAVIVISQRFLSRWIKRKQASLAERG